ncbi:unnamed protein product, partial [Discosporangium mesarthrocarpum]
SLAPDRKKFERLLESKTFASHHGTPRIHGRQLTVEWLKEGGFRDPVIITDKEGLGLKV